MKNAFLVGEITYLRPITEADLTPKYRDWFNDEEVCQYNSHHRFPNYDENMHDYYERVIKSKQNLVLAICDKENDEHIGNIALENIDTLNQSAELAILIGEKSRWGKGFGKCASKRLIKHAFEELNLHRIYLGTTDNNSGMEKLAESLGFTREGHLRETTFKGGAFRDTLCYGLLRGEQT